MMGDTTNKMDSTYSAVQSREEECEPNPEFVEEKFRVDRKKLKEMMQDPESEQTERTERPEEFFGRIMAETKTHVIWPRNLKIGAKSKKDPFIKVIGSQNAVKAAKTQIMSVLDGKSNRVTLKMDVSHTDHSYVIGKQGNNIRKVMMETGCHIHFPDSNRNSKVELKSNQVSIAGQPIGVETARVEIRGLLPLIFKFDWPTPPEFGMSLWNNSLKIIKDLQLKYNVKINFGQHPETQIGLVSVKGSILNAQSVMAATSIMMKCLTGSALGKVTLDTEIAPQHQQFIRGHRDCNVLNMMCKTKTEILFPQPPSDNMVCSSGTVTIRGSIENVFSARQLLFAFLPLVLMFDVNEEIDLNNGRLVQLMEKLDVWISIKPKPKQPSRSVIVKSAEMNAQNMFLARQLLLGLPPDMSHSSQTSAAFTSLNPADLGLNTSGNLHSSNTLQSSSPSFVPTMNDHNSPVGNPNAVYNSNTSNFHHWLQEESGVLNPVMPINPVKTWAQPATLDVLSQYIGYKNDVLPYMGAQTPRKQGSTGSGSECTSPSTASSGGSPYSAHCNQGSAVEGGMLHLEDYFGNLMTQVPPAFSDSDHRLGLLARHVNKPTFSYHPPPCATASLFPGNPIIDQPADASGMESDGLDKRKTALFSTNPLPFPFDYEQIKLLAMKGPVPFNMEMIGSIAMQENPRGESRIPTDIWSGMGFSKSMPESIIRDNLIPRGYSQSEDCGASAPSQHETTAPHPDDDDEYGWKDMTRNNIYQNRQLPYLGGYDSGTTSQGQPGQQPESRRYLSENLFKALRKSINLAEVLQTLGFLKYFNVFQAQEIDLATFQTLTEQDLKDLGITTFGARRKMVQAIACLNNDSSILLQQAHAQVHHDTAMPSPHRPDSASHSGHW